MPHGLDHLDGNQLVESSFEIAVVLEQQRDAVLQTLFLDAPLGIGELLVRQRRGGHPAAMVDRGIQRHAAPAGTDLQQMIVGLQIELRADALQLVQLGLLQALLGRGEHGRRVHHGRIEEALEQLVAQVVMRGDIALRTGAGVAVEPVQRLDHRLAEQRQRAALDAVQHIQVGNEQADHGGQVRAGPVTMDVRLARADGAACGHQSPETGIEHMDLGLQRACQVTEQLLLVPVVQRQLTVTQLVQLMQHGAAQQAGGQSHPGQRVGFDGQARALHGGLLWSG